MGYQTEFSGEIDLDRPVDPETAELLDGLARTMRVKRNVGAEYGEEGEFYIKDDEETIFDHNNPPGKQPNSWLNWVLTPDRQQLTWDGGEKFYDYVEWLVYLRDKILNPRGYRLEGGCIYWFGQDDDDRGMIEADDNEIIISYGKIVYEKGKTY